MKNFTKNQKAKTGFTLAEVLISLAVLSILMGLTVPTLINNTNNKTYAAGFLRAELMLKQATAKIMSNNGGTIANSFTDYQWDDELRDKYCTYLSCVKKCNEGLGADKCYAASPKTLTGSQVFATDLWQGSSAILSNGMSVLFSFPNDAACSYWIAHDNAGNSIGCSRVFVDVNGLKPPNLVGRDIFMFYLYRDGIIPAGVGKGTDKPDDFVCSCRKSGDCNNINGGGCGAKIILEGNKMNY